MLWGKTSRPAPRVSTLVPFIVSCNKYCFQISIIRVLQGMGAVVLVRVTTDSHAEEGEGEGEGDITTTGEGEGEGEEAGPTTGGTDDPIYHPTPRRSNLIRTKTETICITCAL